jgi:hypothetical protein
LLEVHVTYLGSLGYFPAWGPLLLNGRSSERLLLMGGPVCAAWSCTLSVHTSPPGCCQIITGGPNGAPPEQVHNHNLDRITLNYSCLVNRLRVVSQNRMNRREVGPVRTSTFCLSYPWRFITHLSDPGWRPDPPPPTGAQWPTVDVFCVDGGCSRISGTASQGACCRHFLH